MQPTVYFNGYCVIIAIHLRFILVNSLFVLQDHFQMTRYIRSMDRVLQFDSKMV